jgi:HEAT repeat protein
VPGLLNALHDPDENTRLMALMALSWINDESALPGLMTALTDSTVEVRRVAIGALLSASTGQGHNPPWKEAIPALLNALRSPDRELRWAAATVLGQLGTRVVPVLLDVLGDPAIASEVTQVLGNIGTAAIPALLDALQDADNSKRALAAREVLSRLGEPAVPGLIDLLLSEDEMLRHHGSWTLRAIGEPAIPALVDLLSGEDPAHRALAAEVLPQMGEVTLPTLLTALESTEAEARLIIIDAMIVFGEDAVPDLLEMLSDKDRNIIARAARALGQIGSPAATLGLLRALSAEDWLVRWSAARALGQIKDPAAAQGLVRALQDEDQGVRVEAAEALTHLGKPGLTLLMTALQSPDLRIQRVAVYALATADQTHAATVADLLRSSHTRSWNIFISTLETLVSEGSIDRIPHPVLNALRGLNEDGNSQLGSREA